MMRRTAAGVAAMMLVAGSASAQDDNLDDDLDAPPAPVAADTGWTGVAGVLGFVTAGAIAGLGAASAATAEETVPSLPLGATATVLGGVMIPVVAGGGGSGDARGSTALRVLGWISYGLFLSNAVILVSLGALELDAEYEVPIVTTTVLGVTSSTLFGVDALVARGRALGGDVAETGPGWSPLVASARDRAGRSVPTLGFALRH